jgi:hypothetical protein
VIRPQADVRFASVGTGASDCPRCGSDLVQPLRWVADRKHGVLVDLRCPDCDQWRQDSLSHGEVAALDRAQRAARQQLVDSYERLVVESMEAEAFCLGMALDLDLVGADDFAPRR